MTSYLAAPFDDSGRWKNEQCVVNYEWSRTAHNDVIDISELFSSSLSSKLWTFALFLKLGRVDVGTLSKKGKIWKVLLLEVYLLVGYLTQLCLCMSPDSWDHCSMEQ